MPSFTKKAIVESFLRLAGKKPLDKITVRDVVDDCGINRNTFYYYFQDIYAVLECVCHDAMAGLPQNASLAVTMTAFFRMITDFAADHPRTAKGLVMSLGHDGLERYLSADLNHILSGCLVREAPNTPPELLAGMTVFLRHGLLGYCLDLTRRDKKDLLTDAEADFYRVLNGLSGFLPDGNSGKF